MKTTRYVTIFEVILVTAVITIIAALTIPFIGKVNQQGQFANWKSQRNDLMTQAGQLVYFDFMEKHGELIGNTSRGIGKDQYDAVIYDARLRNGAKWTQGRWQMRGGVVFNGQRSYVSARAKLSSEAYSMFMWFRTSVDNGGLFSTGETISPRSKSDRSLYFSKGKIVSEFNRETIVSEKTYNDGEWHMVALSVNSQTKRHKLYVDGELVAEAGGFTFGLEKQQAYFIGFSKIAGFFNGVIDELAIFDRELSAAEILNVYKNGAP